MKVNIDGVDYVFDPSFKTHTEVAGIDLATAMGYNRATFLAGATASATVGADFIQNLSRDGVRNSLASYASNLVDFIRTELPDADLDAVIGGRSIDPAPPGPLRQTSLPYTVSSAIAEWTEIPPEFRARLQVQLPGIDETFYSDDIYGKRLTIFYNGSNQPDLRLDGTLIATGSAANPGTSQDVHFFINQPYAGVGPDGEPYGDRDDTAKIEVGGSYLIANSWGWIGRGIIERHRKTLQENRFDGSADDSEPVLGESLAMIAASWSAQTELASSIADQINGTVALHHHRVGIAGMNAGPFIDLPLNLMNIVSKIYDPSHVDELASVFSDAGFGSALESGVIEQSQPVTAVSTVKLLDIANSQSDKIFDVTSANYAAVNPQLVNYDSGEIAQVEGYINDGYRVILPQDGNLTEGTWQGIGFLAASTDQYHIAHIISDGLNGGFSTAPTTPTQTVIGTTQTSIPFNVGGGSALGNIRSWEPIDLVTGDYLYDHDDISLGSSEFPLGLSFQRSYNSAARLRDGPLGLGWRHNFDITAQLGSDAFQGMGEDSPIDAAAMIVATYVSLDLMKGNKTLDELVTAALVQRWGVDHLIDNVVVVSQPGNSQQFVGLADGTYNPPPGSAAELSRDLDGSYLFTAKDGVQLDFDTDGKLATWSNPNGVTVTFGYSLDKLQSVTNGLGRTLTFTYTGDRITQVSDGTGRSVTYAYDATGNLTDYTDTVQNTTTYTYDQPGRMTQVYYPSNPLDPFVTNVYDSLDRVETQTDARNNTWSYYFAGHRAEEVDPLNNSRAFYYNDLGKVVKAIDQLNNVTTTEYDAHNRVVIKTAPEGNSVEFVYDAKHNPITVTTRPKPGSPEPPLVQHFTYDPTFNKVTSATDALDRATYFTIDPQNGNLQQIDAPEVDGAIPSTIMTYNALGQIETVTDPQGKVTRNVYNPNGDLRETIEDDGGFNITTSFTYNAVGDVITVEDPRRNVTTSEYDARRLLTKTTAPTPFEYETILVYDADGHLRETRRQTDSSGQLFQIAQQDYDLAGNRSSVTDPIGNTTTFDYDPLDRLASTLDAELRQRAFEYDAAGRVSKVVDLVGGFEQVSEEHTYTVNGLPETLRDGRDNPTTITYDDFDRPSRTTYSDDRFEELSYDPVGNVLSRRTWAGDVITFEYDELSRLKAKTVPRVGADLVVTYDYDLTGRLLSASDGFFSVTRTYDTAGRLGEENQSGRAVQYEHDEAGNITRITWPDQYAVEYTYDELGRMAAILDATQDPAPTLVSYRYDTLSRRTLASYANNFQTSYGYALNDDLQSIVHTRWGGEDSFSYLYNGVGQRISQDISNAAQIYRPQPAGPIGYVANDLNQYSTVAAVTHDYDDNGNLTYDGVNSYGYDAENRLADVTTAALTVNYAFDPLDRRVEETAGGQVTEFFYSGVQEIAEYDGLGDLVRRFVPGAAPGEIVATVEESGTRYFHHADVLGSTVALSDDFGAVVERHAYGPWGEESATPGGTPFRFTGQRFDAETGLYHCRARAYSPALGRFLQPDPIGTEGGINLYAYVENDPLNATDPSGLFLDAILDVGFIAYDIGVLAYDELARGGANRTANVIALGADVAGLAVPFVTGAGQAYRAGNKLVNVARQADAAVSLGGSASVRGTAVHTEFNALVTGGAAGRNVAPETAYIGRTAKPQSYRPAGSVNPDAVVGYVDSPAAVFDLKTGVSGFSSGQMSRYRAGLPSGTPVYELRTSGHGAPRPTTYSGVGAFGNTAYQGLK